MSNTHCAERSKLVELLALLDTASTPLGISPCSESSLDMPLRVNLRMNLCHLFPLYQVNPLLFILSDALIRASRPRPRYHRLHVLYFRWSLPRIIPLSQFQQSPLHPFWPGTY